MSEASKRQDNLVQLLRDSFTAYLEGRDTLTQLVRVESIIDELAGNPDWVEALHSEWSAIEIIYASALDRAERGPAQEYGRIVLDEADLRQVGSTVTTMVALLDAFKRGKYRLDGEVTLFRPVGPHELELIRQSGYREFPPRLPEQPIFYPVLNMEYATKIARDWNAKDPSASYKGYVTCFRVRRDFLSLYKVQTVGSRIHQEYWIPAEDLPEFNRNIVGAIEVIAEFPEPPHDTNS